MKLSKAMCGDTLYPSMGSSSFPVTNISIFLMFSGSGLLPAGKL